MLSSIKSINLLDENRRSTVSPGVKIFCNVTHKTEKPNKRLITSINKNFIKVKKKIYRRQNKIRKVIYNPYHNVKSSNNFNQQLQIFPLVRLANITNCYLKKAWPKRGKNIGISIYYQREYKSSSH